MFFGEWACARVRFKPRIRLWALERPAWLRRPCVWNEETEKNQTALEILQGLSLMRPSAPLLSGEPYSFVGLPIVTPLSKLISSPKTRHTRLR